jgi:integrase/recombinase XerD
MTSAPDPLFSLVESFFRDYLQRMRGASRHTVLAYRDALRLFFGFVADSSGHPVSSLRLDHLTAEHALAFLDHLESSRHNLPSTRNLRLTALRSLCRHLLRHDPTRAGQYQRVLSLPVKRTPQPVVTYLEPEEVRVLLRQPDLRKRNETRDHALLLFLYNTGARISEALAVQRGDLQLARPFQVQLHGKGRKNRICPLWKDTVTSMKRLLNRSGSADNHVFISMRGTPLSRDGADYILQKHFRRAGRELPALRRKHVTPHGLRHSCAVAMLQAGIDLSVIRDYLGHESIATTGRYTKTNVQMKRRVLEAFWKRSGLTGARNPAWRPSSDLLSFLSSL